MYPLNLLTIVDAHAQLADDVLHQYLAYKHVTLRKSEIADIAALIQLLYRAGITAQDFTDFYVGFQIEQIGKEFDLLRISENSVINIEIKSINTAEKMKRQLVRNEYYLRFLKRPVYHFTYVHEENQLYYLSSEQQLMKAEAFHVVQLLQQQQHIFNGDLHTLFDVTKYLISPFHHTAEFLEGQYFLNSQQSQFKARMMETLQANEQCIALTGDSGTGKSLLIYDVAHALMMNGLEVLLLHSGPLNDGHHQLQRAQWHILSTSDFQDMVAAAPTWHEHIDIVIIDEAQRLPHEQLSKLLHYLHSYELNSVFAYDPEQYLSFDEEACDTTELLQAHVTLTLELTAKFRAHKEIIAFIQNLFDFGKRAYIDNFSRISVEYFNNEETVRRYLQTIEPQWKVLHFTHAAHEDIPQYELAHAQNSHAIIGQEFDDVAVVMDEHFTYREGKLVTVGWSAPPSYHPTKMLYQNLTRARKNIKIIVLHNDSLLRHILQILQGA